jgi:hypothetical protein
MPYYKKYYSSFLLFFFISIGIAQEYKTQLIADEFIGIDYLQNTYFIKDNTLYKKGENGYFTYTNYNLGNIENVDISNPLKILIFFKEFNTIVWLDNNLNEINTPLNLTNIINVNQQYVANAFNNNIWTYNLAENTINLINTITLSIEKSIIIDLSNPIQFVTSNYRAIYLFSSNEITEINFMGTIKKYTIDATITYAMSTKKSILYQKNNTLFVFDLKTKTSKKWKELPKKAKRFFVLDQSIYIFENNYLHQYSLPKTD